MKKVKHLLGVFSLIICAYVLMGATTNALYLHHERSTLANLEADLQNRELGLNPTDRTAVVRFSSGLYGHLISQEQPAVALTGTLSLTGAATLLSNATIAGTLGVTGAQTGSKITLSDSVKAATANVSGLTASRLMATNSGKTLASVSDLTSWIAGTSNQITSTSDGDGSITLSIPNGFTLPSASPTFTGLTLTGNETIGGTLGVTGASTLAALSATTGGFSSSLSVGGVQSNSEAIVLSGNGTGGAGRLFNSTTNGLVLRANTGSAYDWYVFSAANNSLIRNPTGGSTLEFPGAAVSVGGTFGVTGAATFSSSITQSAGVLTVSVDDNTANAVDIQQGADNYIYLTTVNGAEGIELGNATTNPFIRLLGSGTKTIDGTINTDLTASRTVVTDGSGNLSVNTETGTGSHVKETSPTLVTPILGVASATSMTLGGGEAFVYGDTSFTLTATGMTTSPTGTAYATRIGNMVTLRIPYVTGTSNAASFTLNGIPSTWVPPSANQWVVVGYCVDNATAKYGCLARVTSSGSLVICPGFAGESGWTSSGTKSIGGGAGGPPDATNVITYNIQ